ncbi:hypothetical protein PR202_ga22094 [Eleusine coracana subsp. coracana]|uniref:Uncharacterized protein n=1 Tax=Eleusine coracana subsp. coracana TaxID=191504 RepID=A0AAV5D316_ELECO|nr:hypothetical protein PR202_ga22094 [Eleusine coracana subsp. coracana]
MDLISAASSSVLLRILVLLLPLSANASSSKIYVVYMGEKKHDDPSMVTASHHDMLTFMFGSKDEALESIVYSYKYGFSGFAAKLTESQVEELKADDDISLFTQAYGQNHGALMTGYGPVPKRWKGVCQIGEKFNTTHRNRKIIGARWYADDASAAQIEGEYMSPRDVQGHGTHTASTVTGVPVPGVSYGGLSAGVARGGAPRARLAIYKACFGKCSDAALLAAVDDAINDGVDILSISVGHLLGIPGTLHAVARGVTVVFSGGNDGPAQQTVMNGVPWAITVAASTMNRSFPTVIELPDGEKLVGQSLYHSHAAAAVNSSDFETIVYAVEYVMISEFSFFTVYTLAATSRPEKVLFDAMSFADKAGAKGIILAQYTTNLLDILQLCEGRMTCVVVDNQIAFRIIGKSTTVKIHPAATVVRNGLISPRVAAFSSRGPSYMFPAVLKPDIAAPGVSILAAKGDSYELISGTSMACPHVSAIVTLLTSVHPDWSPAMIKSAIVTTASVTDRFGMPIQVEGPQRKPADPFDFGGGHIDPDLAVDPGLVYDIDPKKYIRFFNCTLGPKEACLEFEDNLYQLNLPSIAIPNLKDSITVWRTVTNVGPEKATYQAKIEAPMGVRMSVEPSVISFKKGGSRSTTFKVTFTAKQRVQGGYSFGSLTWFGNCAHSVRIPVAVRTVIQDFVADTT